MGRKSDRDTFMKLLAIIGAVLIIIGAILCFISLSLISIAYGLVWFVIGLIILMSCFKPNNPIPFNEGFILIMGVIALVLAFVIPCHFIVDLIAAIIILIGGFIGLLT